MSETQFPFSTNVRLDYEDGTSETIEISLVSEPVVDEARDFRRHLTAEEISYLRGFLGEEAGSTDEASRVEETIRSHYEAIGENDFQEAYSYFGPAFRATIGQEEWIADEESFDIRSSTVNSVVVEEVSGESATATVDVSFEDNTGTPRFVVTWGLVKEDGRWKLDEVLSGERVEQAGASRRGCTLGRRPRAGIIRAYIERGARELALRPPGNLAPPEPRCQSQPGEKRGRCGSRLQSERVLPSSIGEGSSLLRAGYRRGQCPSRREGGTR